MPALRQYKLLFITSVCDANGMPRMHVNGLIDGRMRRAYDGIAVALDSGMTMRVRDGLLHTDSDDDDQPSYASRSTGGTMLQWHRDGVLHRNGDRPARVTYRADDDTLELQWYRDGRMERGNDKPACTRVVLHTRVRLRQEWRRDGKLHRDSDKPALIIRDADGTTLHKEWCRDSYTHREPRRGPAIISARDDGTYRLAYAQYDKLTERE